VEPRTSCQYICPNVLRDYIKLPSLLLLLAHLNSDTHSVRWITYVLLGVSGACLILLVAGFCTDGAFCCGFLELAWKVCGWARNVFRV